jgi:transcription elongation factor GreA
MTASAPREAFSGFIGLPSISPRSEGSQHECLVRRHAPGSTGRPQRLSNSLLRWYPAEMASTKLSPGTYERLQAELEDLKTRGRVDIARHIEAARALGDLSENGDYHAAKDSQGKMEARIRQLEAMLKDAEVVEGGPSDEVAAGVTVRLKYVGDDEVERYLVGSIEEREAGTAVISPGSPLGQALMGKRAGATVTYDAPSGQLAVEIVSVGD